MELNTDLLCVGEVKTLEVQIQMHSKLMGSCLSVMPAFQALILLAGPLGQQMAHCSRYELRNTLYISMYISIYYTAPHPPPPPREICLTLIKLKADSS